MADAFSLVQSRGANLFKNTGVFLERFYSQSRHIEVQVFGNGSGTVVHFGERECSLQRRHQKVVEESPSPFVEGKPELRAKLTQCATKYAAQLNYKSAGTVEFLVDDETGNFFFLEMNTRLQVEHPVTEFRYNIDLVSLMLHQADYEKGGQLGIPAEELLAVQNESRPSGSAVEVRIYAEVPHRNYAPSPGLLQNVVWPEGDGIRVDTWVSNGQRIAPFYDPLIAKLIVHDKSRPAAQQKMLDALAKTRLQGPPTNLEYLTSLISTHEFAEGKTLTNFLSTRFSYTPLAIDVASPGSFTTIQDYPARIGAGHGIPVSGPMDNISSRIANLLVGNSPGMEVLECTVSGPELLFHAPAVIAITGARMAEVLLDGEVKPMWSRLKVAAGQTLKIGKVEKEGCRCYIAVLGGFPEVASYLGSKSCTPSLAYGGTQGRQVQKGDLITLSASALEQAKDVSEYSLPTEFIPMFNFETVYAMHGPHDSDDIMTADDRQMLYTTSWKIGHNSNRTGVRLHGPAPTWARKDGGEGGAHPSNVFDYGYPYGGINWTGDVPVIFTMDSPNLGGLVCSTTIPGAELFRIGQLKPSDSVRLTPINWDQAVDLTKRNEQYIQDIEKVIQGDTGLKPKLDHTLSLYRSVRDTDAILKFVKRDDGRPDVTYRQAGDSFMIVKYGRESAEIRVMSRVRLLTEAISSQNISHMALNPNVGTVTVQFDPLQVTQHEVLSLIQRLDDSIDDSTTAHLKCRELRLPTCIDHPKIEEAVQRYISTTRPNAAYLPDNLEYLRKNNGLSNRREAFDCLLRTPFLTVAVGFLIGTPILFPLDPKSTIVGQKYNPSRVSTPGGTIGMGGSLFCVYPVEAPGGYMIVAMTLEAWDTFGTKPNFSPKSPWLYEPGDLVSFYEVSMEEFTAIEADFKAGRYKIETREVEFDVNAHYEKFEAAKKDPDIVAFKERQREGAAEMMDLENKLYTEWMITKETAAASETEKLEQIAGQEGGVVIESAIDANVWKVLVEPGDILKEGQLVAILEAMKMEINVYCSKEAVGAEVVGIMSQPGSIVAPGKGLVVAKRE